MLCVLPLLWRSFCISCSAVCLSASVGAKLFAVGYSDNLAKGPKRDDGLGLPSTDDIDDTPDREENGVLALDSGEGKEEMDDILPVEGAERVGLCDMLV